MKTDYISRRAFVEAKEKQYCRNCDRRKNSKGQVVYSIGDAPCRACGIRDVLDDVEDFPAADVRPVKEGEWVKNKDRVGWHCSVCKVDNNYAYSWNSETGENEFQDNYCPNCGAKMGGTDGRKE